MPQGKQDLTEAARIPRKGKNDIYDKVGDSMSENALVMFHISRVVFALANILLMYTLLTSRRPRWVQLAAFGGTAALHLLLRELLTPSGLDPFLIGYLLALLYFIPVALVFKERIQVKVFVVFMVLSWSQFNLLVCLFAEQLLFGHMVSWLVLSGQLLGLLAVPLIRRYLTAPIKSILEMIHQQNYSFSWFPFFSFVLLAFYGVQRKYLLSVFIPLVLSSILIFFAYYLIALSIEQTKRQRELEMTARTDSLTGLYNRRHMEERLGEEYGLFRRNGLPFALLIVDLDWFKSINDRFGHGGGDYLLRAVADELRQAVREYDVVARWGGDEFLLLLPATTKEQALRLAERIRATVAQRRYAYENQDVALTLTLGVFVARRDSDTLEAMIKQADALMYRGKRAGRNRIVTDESPEWPEAVVR